MRDAVLNYFVGRIYLYDDEYREVTVFGDNVDERAYSFAADDPPDSGKDDAGLAFDSFAPAPPNATQVASVLRQFATRRSS